MPLWHGWLIRRQAKQKQGGGDLIVSSSKSCQTSSDVILVWMGEVGWPRDQWAAKWRVTHCWWEYSAGVECMCVCVVSESLKVCGEWDTKCAEEVQGVWPSVSHKSYQEARNSQQDSLHALNLLVCLPLLCRLQAPPLHACTGTISQYMVEGACTCGLGVLAKTSESSNVKEKSSLLTFREEFPWN